MPKNEIYETVTIKRPIAGPIRDLVFFVKNLHEQGLISGNIPTDEALVIAANDFWDNQHGDDYD